jgi:hypothetical protein
LGSVVPVVGTAIGGAAGALAGGLGGGALGGASGAVQGGTLGAAAGLGGVGNYGASRADQKAAMLKSSAKPGKGRKKGKLARKMESSEINNSTMKETNNKSTFDRLFEDVMGEDFEEFGPGEASLGDELGGEEFGGEEELTDTVTLELPRDIAEALHGALMEQLGGDEGDVEDLEDAEGLEGGDENLEDSYQESHVELENAPDSITKLATQNGGNNKVEGSGHTPGGGSASSDASGQANDGKPTAAGDGFNYGNTKNNKVKGSVSGGNKDMFKA